MASCCTTRSSCFSRQPSALSFQSGPILCGRCLCSDRGTELLGFYYRNYIFNSLICGLLIWILAILIPIGTAWIGNWQSVFKWQMPEKPLGIVLCPWLRLNGIEVQNPAIEPNKYKTLSGILQKVFYCITAAQFFDI